jgi:hypothetical protein
MHYKTVTDDDPYAFIPQNRTNVRSMFILLQTMMVFTRIVGTGPETCMFICKAPLY